MISLINFDLIKLIMTVSKIFTHSKFCQSQFRRWKESGAACRSLVGIYDVYMHIISITVAILKFGLAF